MDSNYKIDLSKKVDPKVLKEYLEQNSKGSATDPTSIFDSMTSYEGAENFEYFEETDKTTGEEKVTVKAKNPDSKEDAAKAKSFNEVLKSLFSMKGFKDKIDTNEDGKVDDGEMKKFLDGIKNNDKNDNDISMVDITSALEKMNDELVKYNKEMEEQQAEWDRLLNGSDASNDSSLDNNTDTQFQSMQLPKVYAKQNISKIDTDLANSMDLSETLDGLQSTQTKLQGDINNINKDITDIGNGTSPKVASSKQAMDTAKQNMDAAVKGDSNIKSSVKNNFATLTGKIQDNDNKISDNASQITEAEGTVSQLGNSISSLEGALNGLAENKQKDASIDKRKSDLQKQIAEKKAELEKAKSTLQTLNKEKAGLEKTKGDLAAKKAKLEPELDKCSPQTKTSIDAYNKAKADFEQVKQTELTAAKAQLDAKVKELNDVEKKIQDKQNSKASMGPLAEVFNKKFKGVLAGKGEEIIAAAEKNGIEPELLAAIIAHETGWGQSNLIKNYNNPGGLRGKGDWQKFDTIEAGLDKMASVLKKGYYNEGRTTPETIGPKYCPVDDPQDTQGLNSSWVGAVRSLYNKFSAA